MLSPLDMGQSWGSSSVSLGPSYIPSIAMGLTFDPTVGIPVTSDTVSSPFPISAPCCKALDICS